MQQRFWRPVVSAALSLSLVASGSPALAAKSAAPPKVAAGSKKVNKLKANELRAQSAVRTSPQANLSQADLNEKARAAAKQNWAKAKRPARPDHMIVKFKTGTTDAADILRRTVLGTTVKKFKSGAELVRLPKGSNVESAINSLKRTGKVEYAEPDYILTASDLSAPNDPYLPYLWGLKNTGQKIGSSYGTPGVDVNAMPAWSTSTGNGVVVAIIDTGLDFNHPDLAGKAWFNPGEIPGDGIDNDGNGYVDDVNGWDFWNQDGSVFDPLDGDEHGTHVAGTIGAWVDNGLGVAGVAPDVRFMSLKFLGPQGGYTSDAISAIEYASSFGVKLSNNSWGGGGYEQALADAIAASGMLFVAAAGNDGEDNDAFPHYPSSYNNDNILSVAAIENTGALAYFSNYGLTSVDVGAPGRNILSTVPKAQPFAAGVQNTNGTYKSLFFGFNLEDLNDASRPGVVGASLSYLDVTPSTPVLVVLDDMTATATSPDSALKPAYQAMLAGYNATFLSVQGDGSAPLPDLSTYSAVIWATGQSYGSPYNTNLTVTDMTNLTNYLNGGGRLLMTGQDAIYGNEASPFFTDTLGVYWINEGETRTTILGEPGSAFPGGQPYDFTAPHSWRDRLVPAGPTATQALTWKPAADYSQAYAYYSGTSMATPHVTGAAALLMAAHPDWTATKVKQQLMSTVKPLPSLAGRTVTGGLVDANAALTASPDNDVPGVPFPGWGKSVHGELDGTYFTDLDDVYSVYLKTNQKLRVWMTSSDPTDFDLYVFGPNTETVNDISYMLAASESYYTSDEFIEFVAPADGTYYIDAFGYQGTGSYDLRAEWGFGPGRYGAFDPALSYSSGWSTLGPSMYTTTRGASVSFSFYGDTVKLWSLKGPNYGLATVTIDGTTYPDVDLYAAGDSGGPQVVFSHSGLTWGEEHTITFTAKGMRSPSGRKTAIAVNLESIEVILDTEPPAAPAELYAIPDNQKVYLDWPVTNSEPDMAGYNVYRRNAGSGTFTKLNGSPIWLDAQIKAQDRALSSRERQQLGEEIWLRYVDTTVVNGQDYEYVIRAVDQVGNESANSPIAWAHPDLPPANVADLRAANHDGSVELTWAPNTEPDIMEYWIFRHAPGDPDGWFLQRAAVSHPMNSFVDTPLTNEQDYEYLVLAIDQWGVQSVDPTYVLGHPSAAPAMPANLVATAYPDGVALDWAPNTEADLQDYLVKKVGPTGTTELGTTTLTDFFDEGTTDLTGVSYVVYARDIYGVSSVPAGVSTFADGIPPAAPTGLTATAGNGSVSLSWAGNTEPDLAGYNLYRSTSAGVQGTKVNTTLIGGTSFTNSGLTNGTTYYYMVTAVDVNGNESAPSVQKSATPTAPVPPSDTTPPTAPTNVQAAAGDRVVNLSWTASTDNVGVTGYEVWYGTGSTQPTTWTLLTTVTGLSYSHTSLTNGTTYWYKVRAKDAAGNSTDSVVKWAMPNTGGVGLGLYENNNAAITYTTTWSVSNNSVYSGGSLAYTNNSGAQAKLLFTGTGIEWIALKSQVYGLIDVYLDGVKVQSVNLYAGSDIRQVVVFDQVGLSNGIHEIRIVRTGTKDPAATNTYINLDAFRVK
jgi:subtilisin family serine protease/fibronectin type 3 domain-containing protein